MLLGGETPVDSYNNPPSNGNVAAAETENSSITSFNGNNAAGSEINHSVNGNNIIQSASQTSQQIADDYGKSLSPKDNNQNFILENNLDLYQPQHQSQTHASPRVQPYDLNIAHQQAHHHHLRSSNHSMTQYNGNNNNGNTINNSSNNGRKVPSPSYKNQNLNMINHQNSLNNSIIYDGIVSSSSGNEMSDMMVLKEEPENGY